MEGINNPEVVEVLISADGKTLWINVDGICRLRACEINNLVVNDSRINDLDPCDNCGGNGFIVTGFNETIDCAVCMGSGKGDR